MNSSERYAPGIAALWARTKIVVQLDDATLPVPSIPLVEEPNRERTTGYVLFEIGKLQAELAVEYRWNSPVIAHTLRIRNTWPNRAQGDVSFRTLGVHVEHDSQRWNSDEGPSLNFPFAQPWGQVLYDVFQKRTLCVSNRTHLRDLTWTPFRWYTSTLGARDLVHEIYNGINAPCRRDEIDLIPRDTGPMHAKLPQDRRELATFLLADYGKHDEAGRQFNSKGLPYAFMNGHALYTGQTGFQKRLLTFPDGLELPTGQGLLRQIGEQLWVQGFRRQWITGMQAAKANTPQGAYFYYGLRAEGRNLFGRPRNPDGSLTWDPLYNWGEDYGITGLGIEHGEDMLAHVAWFSGDFALEIMTQELGHVLMSILQTHGIGQGGVFGGGIGVRSGVNERGVWRILRTLWHCARVLGNHEFLEHIVLKLGQILDVWLRQDMGALDNDPRTLINGERIPYRVTWQAPMMAWLVPFANAIQDDYPSVAQACKRLVRQMLEWWVRTWAYDASSLAWSMPKIAAASDPFNGRDYGTWHDGLVAWASPGAFIHGVLEDRDEDRRVQLESYFRSINIPSSLRIEPVEFLF